MGERVAVWNQAGSGNKINPLKAIPSLPLAFRGCALYMYYVGENLMVAETGRALRVWHGGKEAHG
jgi:hypothetical protein